MYTQPASDSSAKALLLKSFLVLPACEEGRGGGHLYRSISLIKNLRTGGADAWLFSDLKCNAPDIPEELWLDKETVLKKNWTLIILDRYRTDRAEIQRWAALGPVLGIDEGLSRKDCDFLIDLLPGIPSNNSGKKANLCAPSLLPLPKKRRTSFSPHKETSDSLKILVSFGAEDAAGLTLGTALALKSVIERGSLLNVVLGPLRKNNETDRKTLEQTGITVIEGKDLKETLADYDLIITHFGITAFEALHARVPVLLINPGAYHEKLSRHAGILSLFISHKDAKAQRAERNKQIVSPPLYLSDVASKKLKEEHYKKCVELSEKAAQRWGLEDDNASSPQKYKTLSGLLLNAKPVVHRNCPLCSAPANRIVGRFPGRTYRICSCGTIFMDSLTIPPTEYNRDYFFSEYQKQYGKTYLDDFPKLQKDGAKRISIINSFFTSRRDVVCLQTKTQKLLDIGCAYGPFLAAARNEGFEVTGIDPAEDAVDYVRKTLGINAVQGTFPESLPEPGKVNETENTLQNYDVITLWYVIEHFEDSGKALTAINNLLKTGGVLAFSTPSAAGISRRKSLYNFLENSPADHWTIWDPRRIRGILNRYGFRLKKRIITGHHPERFPFFKAHREGFLSALSRIFGLGDTFEAYAVKVRDCEHV